MAKTFLLIFLLGFVNSFKNRKAVVSSGYDKIDTSKIISIAVLPSVPLIEKDKFGQYLNFDIILKNQTPHVLDISAIEVSVIDNSEKLVFRKTINRNGHPPGIETIGTTVINPGQTISIFNPFYTFSADVSIHKLMYKFFFNYSDTHQQKEVNKQRLPIDFDLSVVKMILPNLYKDKANFCLPLKGKIIVWDGHDFYSHHRRFTIGLTAQNNKGIKANSNRYAYDFVSIDENGNMYKYSPFKKQNWYVFGKPVYAPASGTVIESQNTIPDNEFIGKIIKSPDLPGNKDPYGMGNHVIIDHGNGEYSVLLHMEKGSIRVKTGQMIIKGQQIGNVGFSGDAIFPHMHYTVMRGVKEFIAEGIPSYFNNYKLYRGSNVTDVKNGRIDSGDIIESDK
jgi:hypothetical protein